MSAAISGTSSINTTYHPFEIFPKGCQGRLYYSVMRDPLSQIPTRCRLSAHRPPVPPTVRTEPKQGNIIVVGVSRSGTSLTTHLLSAPTRAARRARRPLRTTTTTEIATATNSASAAGRAGLDMRVGTRLSRAAPGWRRTIRGSWTIRGTRDNLRQPHRAAAASGPLGEPPPFDGSICSR